VKYKTHHALTSFADTNTTTSGAKIKKVKASDSA